MSETQIKSWRIIDIINWGSQYLKSKGIDEARLTIELMLCHVLKCRRIDLYIDFERPLTKSELEELRNIIKRRLKREPLQYIIGKTEFMGLEFKISPDVLIPRPETEILVEKTIETIKKEFPNKTIVKVLDIGAGSGNISISIAKFLGEKVKVLGIDLSDKAIQIAEENAKLNNVENVEFMCFDFFDADFENKFQNQFDIIVSNPPYISKEEFETLQEEIKNHEPRIALTDESDGLTFFRRLADLGKKIISNRGFILAEMAYNQAEKVKEIFKNTGYKEIETFKDYIGFERVIKIKV
jgi:release factor glutamine methyltransferase